MNDIEILEEFKSRTILYSDVYAIHIEELKKIQKAIENLLKERQADKDRIKEKIEWLREISDNGINAVRFAATHDDEIERMQKQKDISTMIGILQELLKESD